MKLVAAIVSILIFFQMSCCYAFDKHDADSIISQRSRAHDLLTKRNLLGYEPALQIFQEVVNRLPEDAQSNMDYGGTLFESASRYFHRDRTPMFDSPALPILQEAAIYIKKAATLYGDNKESRFFKSNAYSLLGDIYHYGLVDLDQAKKMYQMSLDIYPGHSQSQKELESLKGAG